MYKWSLIPLGNPESHVDHAPQRVRELAHLHINFIQSVLQSLNESCCGQGQQFPYLLSLLYGRQTGIQQQEGYRHWEVDVQLMCRHQHGLHSSPSHFFTLKDIILSINLYIQTAFTLGNDKRSFYCTIVCAIWRQKPSYWFVWRLHRSKRPMK